MLNLKSWTMMGMLGAVFVCPGAYALDLSLNDAIDKIVAESQDMKKADANLKKAQAQLTAANANRWFKIDGSATYMNMINVENPSKSSGVDLPPALGGLISDTLKNQSVHIEIPDNILMMGVSVSQPIYTFGKIGNAVKSVKSAIKMSESSRELTLREVRYSAANVYWTAKMTDEIVRISAADLRDARCRI